jgi:hypothetical protein
LLGRWSVASSQVSDRAGALSFLFFPNGFIYFLNGFSLLLVSEAHILTVKRDVLQRLIPQVLVRFNPLTLLLLLPLLSL